MFVTLHTLTFAPNYVQKVHKGFGVYPARRPPAAGGAGCSKTADNATPRGDWCCPAPTSPSPGEHSSCYIGQRADADPAHPAPAGETTVAASAASVLPLPALARGGGGPAGRRLPSLPGPVELADVPARGVGCGKWVRTGWKRGISGGGKARGSGVAGKTRRPSATATLYIGRAGRLSFASPSGPLSACRSAAAACLRPGHGLALRLT